MKITEYIEVKRLYFPPKVRVHKILDRGLLVQSPTGTDGGSEKDPDDPETTPETDPDKPIDPFDPFA